MESYIDSCLYRTPWPGYQYIDAARLLPPDTAVHATELCNHGGLAFIYRASVKLRKRTVDVAVFYVRVPVRLCVDRRPSFHTFRRLPTRQSGGQCDVFQRALICVQVAGYYCPVIICGDRDFNIHVDRDNDVHGAHLADVLQLFDYVQHVTGPTHKLDILSTSSSPK